MKICHFHCPKSLNLLIGNFLCPTKFVFPLLTPCQHCCRIHSAVLTAELQPSWDLFLHSTKAQMQTRSSLPALAVACYQFQFRGKQHFPLQDGSSFNVSLESVCCYPRLDNEADGIWAVTSGALGVVSLFTFTLMVPSPCALPPPMQAILQGKDYLYALCWCNTTDHAPLDATAIYCNSISNTQTISQKQSHPAEPKLTPKRLMEKKKPIKPLKSA